jgi:glucose/arabinose dehydrogenase
VHALVTHPETGEIWGIEHGDEANILKPGGNYGWPYVSVGGSGGASGTPQPEFPLPPGLTLEAPHIEWKTPDIHPTGLAFYTSDRMPKWKDSIFVGGLSTEQLHRTALTPDAGRNWRPGKYFQQARPLAARCAAGAGWTGLLHDL